MKTEETTVSLPPAETSGVNEASEPESLNWKSNNPPSVWDHERFYAEQNIIVEGREEGVIRLDKDDVNFCLTGRMVTCILKVLLK